MSLARWQKLTVTFGFMTEGEISLATVLAKREGLAWQLIADEGVIIDLDRNMLRGLNLSAWQVWSLIDGVRSLRDIGEQVAAVFPQELDLVRNDVLGFAHELVHRNLVQVVN